MDKNMKKIFLLLSLLLSVLFFHITHVYAQDLIEEQTDKLNPLCTYQINPTSLSLSSSAVTVTFVIETTGTNCDWTIGSDVPWITADILAGTGTSTITLSITANDSYSTRTGTITITGSAPAVALTITQQGVNTCTTALIPSSMTHDYNAYTGGVISVTVSHPSCTWSAVSSVPWISVASPTTGFSTGSGTATYTLSENTTGATRTGKIYIGGSEFNITQEAKPQCPISITATPPTSYSTAGGQGTITITALSSCSWSASSSATSWLTLSPTSGTGNGLIVYTVAANNSSNPRSAYIVVGGNSVAITQQGYVAPVCSYTMTPPPELPLSYHTSSNNVVIVDSNPNNPSACKWTAISNVSWLTITSPVNGQGAGTNVVKFSVAQNTSGSQRTGSITLLGTAVSIDITQSSLSIDSSGIGQALDNTSLTWQTGGSLPFFVDSSEYIYGASSARSGLISDSQSSWLQSTVTGPGTLSFYWKVSSEKGFDFMRFTIDGVKYSEITGESDWQNRTFDLSDGSHILRWTYSKDSTASAGADAGWLDKVEFRSSAPVESDSTAKPLYRFFNTHSGAHFFTASESERQKVIDSYPQFRYEGIAYRVYLTKRPDTSGVYRFFNTKTSVHFYTLSEEEKDEVLNQYPHFIFEGIAFYGSQRKGAIERPVYRFFNKDSGTHFYTIDESEKEHILGKLPQFNYEGTAYFASP